MIHINNAIKRHGHLNERNERMTKKFHDNNFVAQIIMESLWKRQGKSDYKDYKESLEINSIQFKKEIW
jgi:hypothetical protein